MDRQELSRDCYSLYSVERFSDLSLQRNGVFLVSESEGVQVFGKSFFEVINYKSYVSQGDEHLTATLESQNPFSGMVGFVFRM